MFSKFTRTSAAAAVLVAVGLLAACGTVSQQQREVSQGVKTEWRERVGTADEGPLAAMEPRIDGAHHTFTLGRHVMEDEFRFELVAQQARYVKSPDVVSLAVGVATVGLGCAIDSTGCFGKSGSWENQSQQQRHVQPTGKVRVGAAKPVKAPMDLTAEIRGFDEQGRELGPLTQRVRAAANARTSVPVAGQLEQLPVKPVRAVLTLSNGDTVVHRETLSQAQLVAMQLDAPQWKVPALHQRATAARLKMLRLRPVTPALGRACVAHEAAGGKVLGALLYECGASLARNKDQTSTEQARGFLQRYLEAEGSDAPHAAESRRLLGGG